MKELTPKGENPLPINRPRIHEAVVSMIPHIQENAAFTVTHPIQLLLRDTDSLVTTLTYSAFPYYDLDHSPVEIKLSLGDNRITYSSRTWIAEHTDYVGDGRHIRIRSNSDTTPTWEGNGFAASLILETNLVLEHQIRHWAQRWDPLPVIGVIVDLSHGTTLERNGWTTHFANQLYYYEDAPAVFKKIYQYERKDIK